MLQEIFRESNDIAHMHVTLENNTKVLSETIKQIHLRQGRIILVLIN
jgi:hypothetical protein